MIITRATADDVPAVLYLLNDAAAWLGSQGSDQWLGGFGSARVGRIVARGGTYIAWNGEQPAATITTNAAGDPALWTPAELAEPSTYFSKMATDRAYAGEGLGAELLRWAVSAAHERGDRWARLDAWRTNTGLHAYYERQEFTWVRTVVAEGRNSGALFQRLALPQSHRFTSAPELPARAAATRRTGGLIPVGAEVLTDGWRRGTVAEVIGGDYGREVVSAEREYSTGRAPAFYRVRLEDGREIIISEADVTEAASVSTAAHV